jgi:SpoIID/LytB domain protein
MMRRLAVLAATALVLSATPHAEAATAQREPASITVSTIGWGHGKGLSQYGARNRAEAGQGYREIVEHYYPGTQWGRATGTIRVLLTAAPTGSLVVLSRPGLKVRSVSTGRTWSLPTKRAGKVVKRWRVQPAGARSQVAYRTSSWHVWKRAKGQVDLVAGARPVALVGGSTYRGSLRLTSAGVVNALGLEAYLRGVVAKEVPASWSPAAVQAQAVAARTYAAFERGNVSPGRDYDLCDTSACQVYAGAAGEHPASDAAVKATAGQVLTYEGAPIFAQFSASNGGWSVDGGYPYLVAEEDPFDHGYPGDPKQTTFTGDQVTRHWVGLGDLVSVEVLERDGHGPMGGRVLSLEITGTEGSQVTSGEAFRKFLGLRTTLFEVTDL